jgi:hypothetical protein
MTYELLNSYPYEPTRRLKASLPCCPWRHSNCPRCSGIFFEADEAEILLQTTNERGGRQAWDNSRYIPTTTTAPIPLLNKRARHIQFKK